MCRIACLRIPKFQIAVHQNHDPALKRKPFVLVSGKMTDGGSGRARVLVCSLEARQKGIVAGIQLSEARAVCHDLIWQRCEPKLYLAAQEQLVHVLIACSPKVTAINMGTYLLDASGLKHLGGEGKFCRDVLMVSSQAGFVDGHVGIADSAFAALVATRFSHRRWHIVPKEHDAEFLAPLSIKHLPMDDDFKESLFGLGIKSLGQLAAFPPQTIAKRFGQIGILACELSQGVDKRCPVIPAVEKKFECSIELGAPIELLSETMFVLKSMLEPLMMELKQEGLWAEELMLTFYNDNDKFEERPIKLIRPSNQPKFLLEVIRLSLEALPLKREFTRLGLAISRFSKESWEQVPVNLQDSTTLTTASKDAHLSESLMLLLQRIATRMGEDAVVKPVANDQYWKDNSGIWVSLLKNQAQYLALPVDSKHLEMYSCGPANDPVLRSLQLPVSVCVELNESLPVAINYRGRWHRVVTSTTAECLSGLWWDNPVKRSYYMVLIRKGNWRQDKVATVSSEGSLLVLLVHDHQQDIWFIEGLFD